MHVCYVAIEQHGDSGGGGVASYVDTFARALVEQGHKVTIVTKGVRRETIVADGITSVRVPLGNVHWYLHKLRLNAAVLPLRELEWSFAIGRALQELIEKTNIDIIEAGEAGLMFLRRGSIRGIPLVVRLHGEQYVFAKHSGERIGAGERAKHRLDLRALRSADGITAPSSFRAREVANELHWATDKITVIRNPVSSWMLEQALKYEENGRGADGNVVLYTGRLAYVKGTLVLLDAVRPVTSAFTKTQFVIAGPRHASIDNLTLNRTMAANGIASQVSMPGHIPWRALVDLYRKASIFVLPSYYETGGISAIEAMAFGLPVVASRAGGLPEVVEDGVTGILVPPGDSQALAEAIILLLRDQGLRKRMGEAGRKRVLDEFTVDRVLAQTLSVYDAILRN